GPGRMRPGLPRPIQAPLRKPPTTSAPWRTNTLRTGSRDGASSARRVTVVRAYRRSPWLDRKVSHHRNVIRGFFPAAHVPVDVDLDQPIGRLWGQQNVVDADAVVLRPGAGLIVPERI